jgi:uncharacterized protein YecT (DUF1311 family)
MRKLFLSTIFIFVTSLQLLQADPTNGGLTDYGVADRQLYHVYWRLFNRLSPADRALLKTNEMRWIDWQDTLPLNKRIQATYDRIALLEQGKRNAGEHPERQQTFW